jgi:hypothetical protein
MKQLHTAFLLALIALSLTITVIPSNAQATAKVSIDPAELQLTTAQVGQTIKVNVNVSNVKNLWAWGIGDISYNSSVLNFKEIEEGPFLKQGGETLFIYKSSNKTGNVLESSIQNIGCALTEMSGVSGDGVLATVTFTVVNAGISPITLNDVELVGPPHTGDNAGTGTQPTNEPIESSSTDGNIDVQSVTVPEFPVWVIVFIPIVSTVFLLLFRGKSGFRQIFRM